MGKEDTKFLRRSIELAKESLEKGGFPAGALIVKNGKIISEAISIGPILHDPTSHAEIVATREACKKLKTTNLKGAVLYESLQSCVMCFSAAYWAGISKIVYACKKSSQTVPLCYEGTTDNEKLNQENNQKIETVYIADYEKDSLALVREWEKKFLK